MPCHRQTSLRSKIRTGFVTQTLAAVPNNPQHSNPHTTCNRHTTIPPPALPSGRYRFGVYKDPFGQIWSVSNSSTGHLEDVPKELARKIVPFVSVRDCAGYMTFLAEALGATVAYPPAKDPTGKVRRVCRRRRR